MLEDDADLLILLNVVLKHADDGGAVPDQVLEYQALTDGGSNAPHVIRASLIEARCSGVISRQSVATGNSKSMPSDPRCSLIQRLRSIARSTLTTTTFTVSNCS